MAEQVRFDLIAHGGEQVKREFEKSADGADHATKSFDGLGKESDNLEKHIDGVKGKLADLRREIAKAPDDKSLRKDYNAAKRDLSFLDKVKDDAEKAAGVGVKVGQEVGKGLTEGLGDTLGAIPSQLKGAAIVAGVGIGAAMAPFIGAAIGGAVLGGVGIGGIVGGVALAAKDPRVQQAGTALGQDLLKDLGDAATPFRTPLLEAIDELHSAGTGLAHDLRNDFAQVAPLLKPLVEGLIGAARQAGPGLSKAFQAAKPALGAIANELPRIGAAISKALSDVAEGSDGGTEALIELIRVLEKTIVVGGEVIGFLEKAYDKTLDFASAFGHTAESAGDVVKYVNPAIYVMTQAMGDAADEADAVKGSLVQAKDVASAFGGSLHGVTKEATDLSGALNTVDDAMEQLFGNQMSLDEATLRYKKGLIDLKKELIDGKRTLNQNTEEGNANAQAIIRQIQYIDDIRKAEFAHNGSLEDANKHYQDHIKAIEATLIKLGYNKKEVEDLITAYKALNAVPNIVKSVTTQYLEKGAGANRYGRYEDGPGRALGGNADPGVSYKVNEYGQPELLMLGTRGQIVSHSDAMAALGRAGSQTAAAPVMNFNFPAPSGNAVWDLFIAELRKYVKNVGGGSVQSALGSSN